MTTGEALVLRLAGAGAGVTGSMAGLASVVSYPTLLATGLPPVAANVTNTVALLGNAVGAAWGSRPELRGQWPRLRPLLVQSALGGLAGAGLLLLTDPAAFEAVVPWLLALGSVLLIAREPLRARATRRAAAGHVPRTRVRSLVVAALGAYGGYFGAGVGIIAVAVLSSWGDEPYAVTNAVKNMVTSAANAVAAVTYLLLAPVDLGAAVVMGAGLVAGSAVGPALVRRAPEAPLRWAVAVAGLLLAVHLARA